MGPVVLFLNENHSDWDELKSQCDFTFQSLLTKDTEHQNGCSNAILLIPSLCAECDPHIHTQFGLSLNDLLFSKGSWSFVHKKTYLPSSNFVLLHQCPSSTQAKVITTCQ